MMSNPFDQDYFDDAYVAGFDGYWSKQMQPPSDMPSDEKEYWYCGYRAAYKVDLEAYNE